MSLVADRLKAIKPSPTLAVPAKAARLRAEGKDIIGLGAGEPDFDTPQFIKDAAIAAIQKGYTKYTAAGGTPSLKKAIIAKYQRENGLEYTDRQILVSVGGKQSCFNLCLALLNPGDEVVIPAPCWVSYPEQVRLMGAVPVIVPTSEDEGWRISPQALEQALSPRTKAVILCTPSNPTGAAYAEAHLGALLDVLRRHDCWIVVDEIYSELVYDGFRHVSALTIAPDLSDRMILVDGVSKSYAMTGWRIGWSIAPRALARACDTVQGQSTTNPSAVAQHAACAALTGPQDEVLAMRAAFQGRRDAMVAGLNALPGVRCRTPEGAFYAFADCSGLYGIDFGGPITSDADVAFFLLDRAHVAAVPGGPFAAPGYVRFSYAASEEQIRAGLARMREAIDAARAASR